MAQLLVATAFFCGFVLHILVGLCVSFRSAK